MTQKQLGERCGMSDAEIRKFESDRGSPTVRSLQRIADALGSSVAFLVDEHGGSRETTTVEERWNNSEAIMRDEKWQALKRELLALLEDEDVKMAVAHLFMELPLLAVMASATDSALPRST